MRDFAKSNLSAALAMSLLGVQSVLGLVRRPRQGESDRSSDALDAVTREAIDRCGNTVREAFLAGDKVQREMVDMAFGMFTLAPFRGTPGSPGMSGLTSQTVNLIRGWLGSMSSSGCSCQGNKTSGPSAQWQDRPPGPTWSRDRSRDDPPGSDAGWGTQPPGH